VRRTNRRVHGWLPPLPKWDGSQPCASIGLMHYYRAEDGLRNHWDDEVLAVLKPACEACPFLLECKEWALYRERWGYWAGMTEEERWEVRRERGIKVTEPQYEILGIRESIQEPFVA